MVKNFDVCDVTCITYFVQRVVIGPSEISRRPHFGTLRVDETVTQTGLDPGEKGRKLDSE
jgi:hypothetical protein